MAGHSFDQPSAQPTANYDAIVGTTTREDANQNITSSLLAFPRELRNAIYEYISTDQRVCLSCRPCQLEAVTWHHWLRLSPKFLSIALVNHQIFAEIQDLAHNNWTMHTMVLDYDFNHIIYFLTQLSDVQLAALALRRTSAIRIKLIVTGYTYCAGLERWLKFLRNGRLRDHPIDFQYHTICRSRYGLRCEMEDAYDRYVRWNKLQRVEEAVEMVDGGKRVADEGEKIKRAIQDPQPLSWN